MAQIAEKLFRKSASECNSTLSKQNSKSNRSACAQIYRDCCVMLRLALVIFLIVLGRCSCAVGHVFLCFGHVLFGHLLLSNLFGRDINYRDIKHRDIIYRDIAPAI